MRIRFNLSIIDTNFTLSLTELALLFSGIQHNHIKRKNVKPSPKILKKLLSFADLAWNLLYSTKEHVPFSLWF